MFSYDPTQAGAGGRDAMRLALGDTQPDGILSDAEYDALLAENASPHAKKLACLRALTAKLSMSVDLKTDGLEVKNSQRLARYAEMLRREEAYGVSASCPESAPSGLAYAILDGKTDNPRKGGRL